MRTIFEKKEPSEWIINAICDSGSPVQTCEHCNRVHYDSTGENMDEGELEDLEAKREKNPDKFHSHDGGVHWGFVLGKNTVFGCPCNFLTRWENIIWNERYKIAQYLKERSLAQLKSAEKDVEIAESLSSIK